MAPTPDGPGRLARSEDIPRAVEKLLQWVVRLICYGIALLFCGLAGLGLTYHWPRLISGVLLALAVLAVCAGRVVGGPCPLVFGPPPPGQATPPAQTPRANSSDSPGDEA